MTSLRLSCPVFLYHNLYCFILAHHRIESIVISVHPDWIKGTYLIYSVEQDLADVTLPLSEQTSITALRSKLNDKLEITLEGKTYRIVAQKSLGHVNTSSSSGGAHISDHIESTENTEALSQALRQLQAPAQVVLASTTPITSADDNIAAVNLFRQVPAPVSRRVFESIVDKVAVKYPRVHTVPVQHFVGGPVQPNEIATCIVTGEQGSA